MGTWKIDVDGARADVRSIASATQAVTNDIADAEDALEAVASALSSHCSASGKLRQLSSAWQGTAGAITARVATTLTTVSNNITLYVVTDGEMSTTTATSNPDLAARFSGKPRMV